MKKRNVRRWKAPPATWAHAQMLCKCQWCERDIAPGGWVLYVGPSRLEQCVACVWTRRRLLPPDSGPVSSGRDAQLPSGDR